MKAHDSERISALTTGAIQTTTENAVKAMSSAVDAVEDKIREMRAIVEQCIEEKTKEMHDIAQQYVSEIEKVTGILSESVSAHVASCQAAIDTFQAHHIKVIDRDKPRVAPLVDNPLTESLVDDIRKLARTNGEGRRQ